MAIDAKVNGKLVHSPAVDDFRLALNHAGVMVAGAGYCDQWSALSIPGEYGAA